VTKRELAKAIKAATKEYDNAWAAVYNADEENCLHQSAMDAILECMEELEMWRKRRDSVKVTSKKAFAALQRKSKAAGERLAKLEKWVKA
jgi:uncharacterized protein YbaP (TraB family)